MYTVEKTMQVYLDLAEMYQQQDAGMREVFLLLAADTALRANRTSQAEQLRQDLLRNNPYHVLKPFPTFVEAAQHPDIQNYLDDLRMKYPPEVAEDLLESVIPATLSQPIGDVPGTEPPEKKPAVLTPPPAKRAVEQVPTTLDEQKQPFKVYRETYEVDETQPPPTLPPLPRQPRAATAPPRPRQAPPRPTAPPPRPAAAAAPPPPRARQAPRQVTPVLERPASPPVPEEERAMAGAWVGTLLYLIVMAVGVGLTVLTLVPYELLRP